MMTHAGFQSSGAGPPSGGWVTTVCAFTSSSAGMNRIRSTGVTVSTRDRVRREQKAAESRWDPELLLQPFDDLGRALPEACGNLSFREDRLQPLDRIRQITVHVSLARRVAIDAGLET